MCRRVDFSWETLTACPSLILRQGKMPWWQIVPARRLTGRFVLTIRELQSNWLDNAQTVEGRDPDFFAIAKRVAHL
jgi:hypothetical protein